MKKSVILIAMISLVPFQISSLAMDARPLDAIVFSNIDQGTIDVRVLLGEDAGMVLDHSAEVEIEYPDGTIKKIQERPTVSESGLKLTVKIDPVVPWHPNSPVLYGLNIRLATRDGLALSGSRRFGMRKLESRDARFYVNNKPFYVRACGHESEYKKYCQSDDRKAIEERLRQVKKYGFNAVRHHSHVPSETYLKVADELGLFIQMEFYRYGKGLGTSPDAEDFQTTRKNWMEMVELGRRHPSTFIYSMGNELYMNEPGVVACMDALYDLAKSMDPGVLVLNRSGSNPFNDDYGKYDLIERPIGEYEHTADFARDAFLLYLRGDRKGYSDRIPIIAHEYPLVASYPDAALAYRYGDRPSWIEKALSNAKKHGLEHLLPVYARNSEAVQAMCRKEMLEEARKFRELDGYSMLRFTDCLGMVSGVVNDFSDPKNVTAEEFLRTNGETVLLCTWNDRTFHYGDPMEATLEISHHGAEPFSATQCQWMLMNGPAILARGAFDSIRVGAVDVAEVGRVSLSIPRLYKPAKLILRAVIPDTTPQILNEWPIWAFPKDPLPEETQANVALWDPARRMKAIAARYPGFQYIADANWTLSAGSPVALAISDRWQESFFSWLENGGRIWIVSDKVWPWPEEVGIFGMHLARLAPEQQAPPIFPELDENLTKWMTICSNPEYRQGNSGTIIYPHQALKDFPHDGFCDMQFWPMIYRAKSLNLDEFPKGVEPVIRAIDSYHRGRSKGYTAELGVGRGKLFISTLNFTQTIDRSAATRYLFNSILEYLTGSDWNPAVRLSMDELRRLLAGYEDKKPELYDELGIRYATQWRKRLSDEEWIVLPIYEAQGAESARIGVHWEYAQTQWYLAAIPSDQLSWTFETSSDGEFGCTFYLGSPLKNVEFNVQIDDRDEQRVEFEGSADFNDFKAISLDVGPLAKGKHTILLSVPGDVPGKEGICFFIRDIELKGRKG